MALETEGLTIDADRLRAGAEGLFAHPHLGFYLVAESDGSLIGQLMISYEWSDWRNGVFWWIQSVYVHPDHRGRGVYRRLYQEVQDRARAQGNVCGIRLYVERENRRAQAVYAKLGMKKAHYEMFEVDYVVARHSV